ncbi:sensor histidine kinase [Streptomyces blastmyceticus]|uniref:histidine kinase n=1 Tax=Streptomyces blastmyceticus TaxID=68180 RepID=A0ABP3GYE3_9ACTN
MIQPLRFARDLFTPQPPAALLGQARRRWVRLLPYAVAALFTAILLPVTATVLTREYGLNPGVATVLAFVQVGPLFIAVKRPLLAWAIAFLGDVAGAAALLAVPPNADRPWPWTPMVIIGMLLLFLALALRERPRTLAAAWGLTGAAGLAFQSFCPGRGSAVWVTLQVLGGILLVLGGALRGRGDARRALAEQEHISEAERARRTLLEERTRIARELHDVVAHHMSVITVQADSAPYRIAGLPPAASEEFTAIAATARESLTEMRRLLGVLRSEDSGEEPGGERAPQPGVTRIPQLVEATVRSGLPVELTVAPDVAAAAAALPQAVDLSAYRIVQEALANVVRHAPGAPTRVSVSVDAESLMVLIVNEAAAKPDAPLESSGTGHGLVGMRERVRLVGGSLDTGPLPEGGYRVAARLPFAGLD